MTASPLKPSLPHPQPVAAARPMPAARSLLAAGLALLLAGPALAAPGERPRPEDYPDFARFIEASVDYQRALGQAPADDGNKASGASRLCREDGGSAGNKEKKKKNSCEGKYLMVKDHLDEETPHDKAAEKEVAPAEEPAESLEERISRTTFGSLGSDQPGPGQGYSGPMSLTEISPDELSNAGIEGLLGLFDNIRMNALAGNSSQGVGSASFGSAGGSLYPDSSVRMSLDDMLISLSTLDTTMFTGLLSFGDGYAVVDATVRTNGNGLNIGLSAEVYTPVYIVDRDGTPGTPWAGAGAATIDRMAIIIPYLDVNIRSVSATTQDNSLLQIDTYSPKPIYVDLSNTGIGAASAWADGTHIGTPTNFLQFGPSSVLTVAAGTRVTVGLARPSTVDTAFITLNGHVGDITLDDIRLVDPVAGGSLRIGHTAVRGINLVDTSIFVDPNDSRLTVDIGRGLTDVDIDLERVEFGNSGHYILGDFYVRDARVNELRFSATPH